MKSLLSPCSKISILAHSYAIPAYSGVIPVDSSGMAPILHESVRQGEIQALSE